MSKVTYVSVVKEGVATGKGEEEILESLKKAFPGTDEKKLKSKISPTVKYLKGKEGTVKKEKKVKVTVEKIEEEPVSQN